MFYTKLSLALVLIMAHQAVFLFIRNVINSIPQRFSRLLKRVNMCDQISRCGVVGERRVSR